MHYQPGENSGGLQEAVWLYLRHLEESPWTRWTLLFFKRPATKKEAQTSMGILGPGDRNLSSEYCIGICAGVTHAPLKPHRQLYTPPFLWVHITDQDRRRLFDPRRLEPLWDSEGREGIVFWFPVLRMLNTVTPLECLLLTAY